MNFTLIFLLACSSLILGAECARILGVFPIPSPSHQILSTKLLYALAARGHEVTFVTSKPKEEVNNVKIVQFDFPKSNYESIKSFFAFQNKMAISEAVVKDLMELKLIEGVLNSTKIQEFLSTEQHFDIVIIEHFIGTALAGFCHTFNAHCVVFSSVGPISRTTNAMGNPNNPSYMPNLYSMYPSKMNFPQRFLNTMVDVGHNLFNQFYIFPKQNQLLQKYFSGAPSLQDLYYNTSLVLLNSHVSVHAPVPLVPNMVPIGGFHMNPPKKLPQELQEYLDNAKEGIIYFSMGASLKSVDINKHTLHDIVKVFKGLKQNILWKWENEDLPEKLSNVMTRSWFPQGDILAHPNVKIFITHGGLLSTLEAIYHGVPVIGIPVHADQELNMANAVQNGYGQQIPYGDLTEETLKTAINEILNNLKYKEVAQLRSRIMHDEQVNSLDKAIFWVEYVLRHNGAPHLRTAVLSLHWYQYLLIDVIAFTCFLVISFLFVLYKITKIFFKALICKQNKKDKMN